MNMYKVGITIQIIFTIIFSVGLIASYTEAEKIKENSRLQITEKVTRIIESKIDLAEEIVNSKKAQVFLADYQIEVIKLEVSSFRSSPEDYVAQITQDENRVKENDYKRPQHNPSISRYFDIISYAKIIHDTNRPFYLSFHVKSSYIT